MVSFNDRAHGAWLSAWLQLRVMSSVPSAHPHLLSNHCSLMRDTLSPPHSSVCPNRRRPSPLISTANPEPRFQAMKARVCA